MVTTRAAQVDDWSSFWPMARDMGTHHHEDLVHARFLQALENPSWAVLVACDSDELMGYASVQDYGSHLRTGDDQRIARLHDLWVNPDCRRQGVGRALVEAVMTWASARVRYVEWQAHEQRSAPFYERLGYHGDPCPQPDYPTFVVDFTEPAASGRP